jgi:hypothetical protein
VRMYYFFFDESYPRGSGDRAIVMAAWAVEQARYTRHESRLSELFKTPVVNQVEAMLDSCDARATLSSAKVAAEILRQGEIDGTNDVRAMARSDNIWSQGLVFLLANLLVELLRNRHQVGTVDVFYDRKTLKPDHRQALEATIRESVAKHARAADSHLGWNRFADLRIRRVQQVDKPASGHTPNKFQMGVWVADKLCSHFKAISEREGPGRITLCDLSDVITRTSQQFDGKAFNAD